MRGEVEIWSGGELIRKENNLLVDGASNYTIQAISFGKGEKAYQQNAHYSLFGDNKYSFLGSLGATPAIITYEQVPDITLSSYTPFSDLPTAPTPLDSKLENSSDVSAFGPEVVVGVGAVAVSSYVPGNGQNLNMIPLDYGSSILSGVTAFQITQGGLPASVLGCYPDGSSLGGTEFFIYSALGDLGVDRGSSIIPLSGTYFGVVNEASSMDVSGFVNMVMSGSPGTTTNYLMSSTSSGLCMSGGCDSTNSGTVEYSVLLGSGDVGAANLYGGIYNMGLWTIDIDKSITSGNTPPFSFNPIYNSRKYKLFAKKGFSKNLCFINDSGVNAGINNYKDLTIKWRIHFL